MRNNKAFLAAPFNDYMDPQTGRMYEDKIKLIATLIKYLEMKGYKVQNSHKREGWGEIRMSHEVCTPLDYEQIKDADVLVAIPGTPPSGGVHIELGWASALGIRTVILLEEGKNYSKLVLGLGKVGKVDYITYHNINDCLTKLDRLF